MAKSRKVPYQSDAIADLAALMRREHIAHVTLDPATGAPTGMILAPTAYLLDEKRRQEREHQARVKKRGQGEGDLPVEPDNPLREQNARKKQKEMLDGRVVSDEDEDMYAHTGNSGDPFNPQPERN